MKHIYRIIFLFILTGSLLPQFTKAQTNTVSGIIYNAQGPYRAAWDLSLSISRPKVDNDTLKDLINTTLITDPQPFFRREWRAGNPQTFFAKTTTVGFNIASFSLLSSAYKSLVPMTVVGNVNVGDIYIVQLRDTNTYGLLEVVEIQDDGCSLSCSGANNLDYIKFTYQLFPKSIQTAIVDPTENKGIKTVAGTDPPILYPNPCSNLCTLQMKHLNETKAIIVDADGHVVLTIPSFVEKTEFLGSSLPSGNYVILLSQVSNEKNIQTLRLVIE